MFQLAKIAVVPKGSLRHHRNYSIMKATSHSLGRLHRVVLAVGCVRFRLRLIRRLLVGNTHRRSHNIAGVVVLVIIVWCIAWRMRGFITLSWHRNIHKLIEETCLNEHVVHCLNVLVVNLALEQLIHVDVHWWVGLLTNHTLNWLVNVPCTGQLGLVVQQGVPEQAELGCLRCS